MELIYFHASLFFYTSYLLFQQEQHYICCESKITDDIPSSGGLAEIKLLGEGFPILSAWLLLDRWRLSFTSKNSIFRVQDRILFGNCRISFEPGIAEFY